MRREPGASVQLDAAGAASARLAEVAKAFGYISADLAGRSLLSMLARARFAGIWVVKQRWPELSFNQIGMIFGGRISNGVRYGFDRAVEYRERDADFRRLTEGCELWEPAGLPYTELEVQRAVRASRATAAQASFPRSTRPRNDFETDAPTIERQACQSVRGGSRKLLAALQREGFA